MPPAPSLIGPSNVDTPTPSYGVGVARHALPEDLLRQASQRLAIMALLVGALWAIGTALADAISYLVRPTPSPFTFGLVETIATINVLVSVALFLYIRRRQRDPWSILDLGMLYMVFIGMSLSVLWYWAPQPDGWTIGPELTWNGVVVLIFAAIIPSSPVRMLVAGFITVSMNPLGMLIASYRGHSTINPVPAALFAHFPDYILVGVSLVVLRVVTRLGQQVADAREMGSYHLGELLGRGGMGEVYRATHRMLARPAAIKLIRREMITAASGDAAELAVKRFRREAEVAASLRSAHTVELYDFGVTPDGTLYFVMELLDGVDLETLVGANGPLPAARVIYILRQVCESLEEAHARGLVHRDIKPANIHLGRQGMRHDVVKVLDFGLVKSVGKEEQENSVATAAGITPGTPAYMAPEVAFGEPFDGRADLYALGCVGYFLLTGRLVFEASTSMLVIAQHMRDAPVPPSKRTELPVPAALEELILSCLAKRPEERPASAAALSLALDQVPGDRWNEAQAQGWWNAHRPK